MFLKRCTGFALLCASLSMAADAQRGLFSPEAKQKAEGGEAPEAAAGGAE